MRINLIISTAAAFLAVVSITLADRKRYIKIPNRD